MPFGGADQGGAKRQRMGGDERVVRPDGRAVVALLPWLASAKTFRSLPAIMKAGGRFLAKGNPAQVYDAGLSQRTVLLEFDGVAQAIAAHDSAEYQAALRVLGTAVDRDLRIVEGVE